MIFQRPFLMFCYFCFLLGLLQEPHHQSLETDTWNSQVFQEKLALHKYICYFTVCAKDLVVDTMYYSCFWRNMHTYRMNKVCIYVSDVWLNTHQVQVNCSLGRKSFLNKYCQCRVFVVVVVSLFVFLPLEDNMLSNAKALEINCQSIVFFQILNSVRIINLRCLLFDYFFITISNKYWKCWNSRVYVVSETLDFNISSFSAQ